MKQYSQARCYADSTPSVSQESRATSTRCEPATSLHIAHQPQLIDMRDYRLLDVTEVELHIKHFRHTLTQGGQRRGPVLKGGRFILLR